MADYYARLLKAELVHGRRRAARPRPAGTRASTRRPSRSCSPTPVRPPRPPRTSSSRGRAKTFETLGAAAAAGVQIESAVVGAYVTAATTISVESYRSLFARALGDEARHLAVLSWVASGKPVGNAFPDALGLEDATTAGALPWLGGSSSSLAVAALLAGPAGARPARRAEGLRRRLADRGIPGFRRGASPTTSGARTSSRPRSSRARRPMSSPPQARSTRKTSSARGWSRSLSRSRRTASS